jgi:hypothetical protein
MISLDPKNWKTLATKFKVKDNGLEKALNSFEKIADDAHDEALKAVAAVTQMAVTLKKTREVMAAPPILKHLGDLINAAEAKKNEIIKSKAAAGKAEAEAEKNKLAANKAAEAAKAQEKAKAADAKAEAEEKAHAADAESDKGAKEGKQNAGFKALTISMLQKVKTARPDAPYRYLLCDAKPFPFVLIAKQINASHRKMLEKLSGGSKRFLKPNDITFDDGHYCFASDKDIPGAARRIQGFLKNLTGRKFAVMFGTQKAADEEDQAHEGALGDEETESPAATAAEGATAAAGAGAGADATDEPAAEPAVAAKPSPELTKGSEAWNGACEHLLGDVRALGKAIQAKCAGEPADFTKAIDGVLAKLESKLTKMKSKLADSLAKANNAPDAAARKAELAHSKTIMAETVKDIKPLAVLIDGNPFMKTNFTAGLSGGLTGAAQAITRAQAATA